MLLAFKPLLHKPFLWKERKINCIIAVIALLLIASLVVPYLPLYHSTLQHLEWNTPCWVNLLLPYIRFSSLLPFSRQKIHFYLLLLHVFKIKIKNEYKNNNHKRQVSTLKKCLLEVWTLFYRVHFFGQVVNPFFFNIYRQRVYKDIKKW